ncbi:MAG: hypothetical protein BZY79_03695 [SAR202 cluster bacterium Casp-Chloro-G4]|nr:hypothetical protein [Chloroflexota bacterium]MDA1227868.1 hypothetical protein [Chloroflexota bacterium]PKB61476.1 MAG: hypothetical protein BZY79_03695 [SAR202 cluster bacterium Casp-Chloro-G4]
MTQWLKKAKITVATGAMALVLVGTAAQGIVQAGSAEASLGHDAELVSGTVYHDQDAKRGERFKKSDSDSTFGVGGRRWSSD